MADFPFTRPPYGDWSIEFGDTETVIRVARPSKVAQVNTDLPEHVASLRIQLEAAERRATNAERVARDAGQANAEAIAAAVKDAMAKLAERLRKEAEMDTSVPYSNGLRHAASAAERAGK